MTKTICSLILSIAAIAGLVIMELKALALGIDGVLLGGVCAVVGGLGGFQAKNVKSLFTSVKIKEEDKNK